MLNQNSRFRRATAEGAPASRKCFTSHQYEKYQNSFWAMPTRWVWSDRGRPLLARVWDGGKSAAVSALPILGQIAHHSRAGGWWQSLEELADLSGLDPGTMADAPRALERLQLAAACLRVVGSVEIGDGFAKQATLWTIFPRISAAKVDSRFVETYFPFRMRWVYGGAWAHMSGPQKALLLGVGGRSFARTDRALLESELTYRLRRPEQADDILDCFDKLGSVRLASVSSRELARATGIARSSLVKAIGTCRRPDALTDTRATDEWLRHSPLAVYETERSDGGKLLFHLREHAEPYPIVLAR